MEMPLWWVDKRSKNYLYLSPWAKNEENNGTLFSKPLKLENSKYLILLNFGSRAEIKTVLIWGWHIFDVVDRKWENGYYINPCEKIEKTEGTLLSPTFKVWESKAPLVLSILAQGLRYSHFLISRIASWWRGWQKMRKSSEQIRKKLKLLYFLPLLKFEKINAISFFFNLSSETEI